MLSDGGQNNTLLNTGTITTTGTNSSAILVFDGATGNTLTNGGTITTSGVSSNGMAAIGNTNTLINNGLITTSGEGAHGLFGNGSNNTLVNNSSINVSGLNAHGITSLGTSLGPITNSGAITAIGPGGLGIFIGGSATFTNTATGSITSQQASGVIANGGGTINNAGTIIGRVTGITSAIGAATITNSGTITGLTAPGLVFQGNFDNSLANTGTINGNGPMVVGRPTAVQFGSGNDTLTMQAGSINGHVEQGAGADTLTMTGGTIGSIDQGGGLDTATISGGRIIGAFNDGDFVTITGGQIGSVNLRVANNVMRMSGGIIDGSVNAEQGDDLFELSGGIIGGSVDLGNGDNTITVTGGSIGNGIVTGTGIDRFTWSNAGTIAGAINLGTGNDIATLRNLTSAILAPTTLLNGGAGTDTLTFDNVETTGVSRFQNWETVALTNGSRLTLDADLVMGDAGTQTGTVSIDATSTLFAGGDANPSILPFTAGQLVTVINAGVIDLTNGVSTMDRLAITGNYVGANGRLLLQTVLGDDASPSDTNVGGPGALTRSDGILVVQAVNGGTTAPTAFTQGGRIVAGAHEYFLFRGGASAGSQESWFLRSSLIPGSTPAAQQPPPPGQPAPPPVAPPAPPERGGPAIPLFRPEVPVYAAVPGTTRLLVLSILSTFHERRGEQSLLQGGGIVLCNTELDQRRRWQHCAQPRR